MKYQDFNLQRHDYDRGLETATLLAAVEDNTTVAQTTAYRWGGVRNPTCPVSEGNNALQQGNTNVITCVINQNVLELQRDLRTLGFLLVSETGIFDRETEWAVREFQIHSKMSHVARVKENLRNQLIQGANGQNILVNRQTVRYDAGANLVAQAGQISHGEVIQESDTHLYSHYVYSLEQCQNDERYTGNVSGVMNERTREIIQHWLENHYRCPVVIEAWECTSNNSIIRQTLLQSNVWTNSEVEGSDIRHFFYDFTTYYTYPRGRKALHYNTFASKIANSNIWGGFTTWSTDSWDETRITPQSIIPGSVSFADLIGTNLNSAQTSTYKIITALGAVECGMHFDKINSYDKAIFSFGTCHWTLGIAGKDRYDDGEGNAFLAFFKEKYPNEFDKIISFFGVEPNKLWKDIKRDKNNVKYQCWLKWQQEDGSPTEIKRKISNKLGDWSWFRFAHWTYRFSMALRTENALRYAMWDATRLRIRDIMGIEKEFDSLEPKKRKLSEVFTSEKAIAILLRWHVNMPGHVANPKKKYLDDVVKAAFAIKNYNSIVVEWDKDPSKWGDTHELILIAKLLAKAKEKVAESVSSSFDSVINWPYIGTADELKEYVNLGSLSTTRNSFTLEVTNLPAEVVSDSKTTDSKTTDSKTTDSKTSTKKAKK